MKYIVFFEDSETGLPIEAESEEEAREKAMEEAADRGKNWGEVESIEEWT